MSKGLYSGVSGLSLGAGLYASSSGLYSGASGLTTGFAGTAPAEGPALLQEDGSFILLESGGKLLLNTA